jgi:hypothetical protein
MNDGLLDLFDRFKNFHCRHHRDFEQLMTTLDNLYPILGFNLDLRLLRC